MNAADRLKAIIAERKEWEAFGWGPILAAWGTLLVVRTLAEVATGPRAEWGTLAYGAALGFQSHPNVVVDGHDDGGGRAVGRKHDAQAVGESVVVHRDLQLEGVSLGDHHRCLLGNAP